MGLCFQAAQRLVNLAPHISVESKPGLRAGQYKSSASHTLVCAATAEQMEPRTVEAASWLMPQTVTMQCVDTMICCPLSRFPADLADAAAWRRRNSPGETRKPPSASALQPSQQRGIENLEMLRRAPRRRLSRRSRRTFQGVTAVAVFFAYKKKGAVAPFHINHHKPVKNLRLTA